MEIDKKQALLVALYTEYQKDLPDMNNVLEAFSAITDNVYVFSMALKKLENEGYVSGVEWRRCIGERFPGTPYFDEALISSKGIEYVEAKLKINYDENGSEKMQKVLEKTQNLITGVLQEALVQVITKVIYQT